jgi:hypothetical protein
MSSAGGFSETAAFVGAFSGATSSEASHQQASLAWDQCSKLTDWPQVTRPELRLTALVESFLDPSAERSGLAVLVDIPKVYEQRQGPSMTAQGSQTLTQTYRHSQVVEYNQPAPDFEGLVAITRNWYFGDRP